MSIKWFNHIACISSSVNTTLFAASALLPLSTIPLPVSSPASSVAPLGDSASAVARFSTKCVARRTISHPSAKPSSASLGG
ncbi:hypothetical protein K439DRAFT_1643389, partial [Ramaria rubella]